MIEYTNSGIANVINEYVHSERDRAIIKRRLIDGVSIEQLAEEFDRTPRAMQTRVANNLSAQELDHMNSLHSVVVQLIDQYRRMNGDPPAEMKAVYDFLHKKHIEHAAEVGILRSMYKA